METKWKIIVIEHHWWKIRLNNTLIRLPGDLYTFKVISTIDAKIDAAQKHTHTLTLATQTANSTGHAIESKVIINIHQHQYCSCKFDFDVNFANDSLFLSNRFIFLVLCFTFFFSIFFAYFVPSNKAQYTEFFFYSFGGKKLVKQWRELLILHVYV